MDIIVYEPLLITEVKKLTVSVRGERPQEHLECILVTFKQEEHILISFLSSIQLISARSLFVSLVKSDPFAQISSGLADMLKYSFET